MRQFDIKNQNLLQQSNYDMANMFNLYSSVDGNLYFNINKTVVVKGLDNPLAGVYNLYTAAEGDHWTTISFKHYNTIELWWLICKFNDVVDPTVSPEAGTILKIPVESVVQTITNGLKEN